MIRIAILHGGPSDRHQMVVDRFSEEVVTAVLKPLSVRPGPEPSEPNIARAYYERVMWPYRVSPHQEVCLYVYTGTR
jgi:hypothetical protein